MQKVRHSGVIKRFLVKKRNSGTFVNIPKKAGQKESTCGKLVAVFPETTILFGFFAFFDKKFSTFSTNKIVENSKATLSFSTQNIGI